MDKFCFGKQHGGALIVGLLILLVMSLIGVAGMQTSTLEEKMAGNRRDRELAFQAAESALRAGEAILSPAPDDSVFKCPSDTGAAGYYNADLRATTYGGCDTTTLPPWQAFAETDWASTTKTFAASTGMTELAAQPRYIIEKVPFVMGGPTEAGAPLPPNPLYRVTAHGVGGTPNAVVILQSTFKLP